MQCVCRPDCIEKRNPQQHLAAMTSAGIVLWVDMLLTVVTLAGVSGSQSRCLAPLEPFLPYPPPPIPKSEVGSTTCSNSVNNSVNMATTARCRAVLRRIVLVVRGIRRESERRGLALYLCKFSNFIISKFQQMFSVHEEQDAFLAYAF